MGVDDGLRYAGLKHRAAACALDMILTSGYIAMLLLAVIAGTKLFGPATWLSTPLAMDVLAFASLVLPVVLYFTLWESSAAQATWGKQRMKIRVVNAKGGRLSVWQALLRSAIKFAPWQLAHTCVIHIRFGSESALWLVGAITAQIIVGIYIAGLMFNKKRQTPYDWLSGAYVITSEGV